MEIELFSTPGLGDSSYLISSEGEAAIVDPQRDVWRFLAVAEQRGWRVTHVLETHVHNDYVSGALELRGATGATIVAPSGGRYEFAHRGADEGTTVEVGALQLTAMATPGHTPEHLAWTWHADGARPDAAPDGVFTGGSLLIGTAGRTDLLGPTRVDELTALQGHTLRRLAALPAGVRILPTHGSGSFCSVGPASGTPSSTVGDELAGNPMLRRINEIDFGDALLAGLGLFPAYYAQMAPLNRAGPRILGAPPVPPQLSPEPFARAAAGGARVVDARTRLDFAAGHLRGALNIELDDVFAAYVGWIVPFDAPLLLVLPDPVAETSAAAVTQLLRIGYEHVIGILAGGIEAWAAAGQPVRSYPTTTIRAVFKEAALGRQADLLDVRQPVEWDTEGIIPGSRTIFVADLPGRLAELPRDHELTVLCKAGSRAAIAASILDAADIPVRLVAKGGASGWADRFAALAGAASG